MDSHGRGRMRTLSAAILTFIAALFTHNASATPPVVNGGAIDVRIPDFDGPVIVNLRQLGAISGSAPLIVDPQSIFIALNGQRTAVLGASVLPSRGPGAVCVAIQNFDYGFNPEDTIELELSVSSLSTPQGTPAARVRLTGVPGPEVNPQDPADELACTDPNARPVADAGQNRTIVDNGAPGEAVVLDGSNSSDANPDNVLTYVWTGADTQLQGQTVTTPPLPPGTYTFSLTVTDDSGDPQTNTSEPATVTITIVANAAPVVNAGEDRTVPDTDGEPGELVSLTGTATDSDGTIASYQWFLGETLLGTGATIEAQLPDGTNQIDLIVTDNGGQTGSDTVTITVAAPLAPTANAGEDQSLTDTDGQPGELVTLIGSGTDPDGTITSFQWLANDSVLGTGDTIETRLPDGVTTVELVVTDSSGQTATDTVVITIAAPMAPTANAGEDQSLVDTDGEAGEVVTLTGTASDPDGTIQSFEWFLGESSLGTGATLSVRVPDGINQITLIATDNSGQTAADDVVVTVAAPSAPTANAGADQSLPDTDGQPGENVTLDGSASVATGGIASYVWQDASGEEIATGATPGVRLPDGQNVLTLTVTSNAGVSATDTVSITIAAAPQMPSANAGIDVTVADTDREPGEIVTLDATASSDPNGQALTYQWSLQAEPVVQLGSGATLSVRLPDGVNTVMLRVEDPNGNVATDTVVITIASPAARVSLAELPNLTPNKLEMARALDRICVELEEMENGETPLTPEQQALNERCDGLYFDNTAANQSQALEALGADDFAAARTQTLLFSNTLYASVMDRLVALRGGARGLSLAGLNIMIDGRLVPLAQMQEMVKGLLGGGASSDADEAGGLLGDKLGVWARGNYSIGEKDRSPSSPSFEADQWALIGGIDYRVSDQSVVGGSFAYGQSGLDFNPSGEGSLDTTSWAASLYGSVYAAKNFYFDAIANFASSDYDAQRNITYVDGSGLVAADAEGSTDGLTLSAGVSAGYDFLLGGFTISPTLGVFYIDATIDGFTETGAAGLNLIYDEQKFSSLTGNLGLRTTYALNTSWGVLLPHVRIDYVREFEDDVDVFGVRFAADPNANSTPPILVETDNPDRSYWRLATGFSAQFAHGLSGYVEYQRLESFQYISFEDLSVGLRVQRSF